MNQDKMHLINKLFKNETIRTVWDKDKEKYYISVIDVVGVLSESSNPRKYWNKLKQRLKEEGNETFDPSITVQRAIDLYRVKGYDEKWISKRI